MVMPLVIPHVIIVSASFPSVRHVCHCVWRVLTSPWQHVHHQCGDALVFHYKRSPHLALFTVFLMCCARIATESSCSYCVRPFVRARFAWLIFLWQNAQIIVFAVLKTSSISIINIVSQRETQWQLSCRSLLWSSQACCCCFAASRAL